MPGLITSVFGNIVINYSIDKHFILLINSAYLLLNLIVMALPQPEKLQKIAKNNITNSQYVIL